MNNYLEASIMWCVIIFIVFFIWFIAKEIKNSNREFKECRELNNMYFDFLEGKYDYRFDKNGNLKSRR